MSGKQALLVRIIIKEIMVETTGVRGPTLGRSAAVSVFFSNWNTAAPRVIIRKAGTWQRAVNRQPASSATRRAGAPCSDEFVIFSEFF